MEVTAADVKRIPGENLHVPRAEFAAVWAAAERRQAWQAEGGVTDWYAGGAAATCRWIATVIVRAEGGRGWPARAPVTRHTRMATPELIDAECLAAERLDAQDPVPRWLAERPGWSAAIVATLEWAWRRTAGPPAGLASAEAG